MSELPVFKIFASLKGFRRVVLVLSKKARLPCCKKSKGVKYACCKRAIKESEIMNPGGVSNTYMIMVTKITVQETSALMIR